MCITWKTDQIKIFEIEITAEVSDLLELLSDNLLRNERSGHIGLIGGENENLSGLRSLPVAAKNDYEKDQHD